MSQPPRIAPTIIKDMHPKLKGYFGKLLSKAKTETNQVHESYDYEIRLQRKKYYSYAGVFYDYLIKKEVHNLLQQEAEDARASRWCGYFELSKEIMESCTNEDSSKADLNKDNSDESKPKMDNSSKDNLSGNNPNEKDSKKNNDRTDIPQENDSNKNIPRTSGLFNINKTYENEVENDDLVFTGLHLPRIVFEEKELFQKLVNSYSKYMDPKNSTLSILEDIFNTSMFFMIWFNDEIIPYDPKLFNVNNLETVVKYVGTWNRHNISINPSFDCEFFLGDGDFIFDDVIFDIKVSKFVLQYDSLRFKDILHKLLLYALGLYLNESHEITKFKIYNPLLGLEYNVEIPELNFTEFLKVAKEVAPL